MHISYVLVSIFQETECALTLGHRGLFPKTRIRLMETLKNNKGSESRGAWGIALVPLGLKGQNEGVVTRSTEP